MKTTKRKWKKLEFSIKGSHFDRTDYDMRLNGMFSGITISNMFVMFNHFTCDKLEELFTEFGV
jgi:hypothetical protein